MMSAELIMQQQPLPPSVATRRQDWPSIAEFYSGRDVFITGGTGHMGKCLIEKMLRSIPRGGRIYVLVRPKKGQRPQERIAQLTESKVFERVRSEYPDMLERLVGVPGDISKDGLGLSQKDKEMLVENASVVIHLAATIQFNVALRESLVLNVLGTRRVMELCKMMKKLDSFVHVSTAYCNCHLDEIDEIVYSSTVSYDKVIGLLEWMTDEQLELLVPSLKEGRPNTYTYTKALAEQMLIREAGDLPLAIFRPAIVVAAYQEPFPGWIDNIYGPAGLFVAAGKGLLRVLRVDPKSVADFVPVDFANNMLLSIGWINAMNRTPQPVIYHINSGNVNPAQWIRIYYLTMKAYTTNPFDQIFRRPHVVQCRPMILWPCYQLFLHHIPGYLADLMLVLMGKKPRIMNIYRKLNKALDLLDHFIQRNWKWSHNNYYRLLSLMTEEEKATFNFDLKTIEWDKYIDHFCMGTKKYMLKEDVANLPAARRQIIRLRNIRYTFNIFMFLLATRLVYLRSSIAREMWTSFMSMCLSFLAKLGLPLLHPS